MNGWIGVDLDGTLAEYHGWNGGVGKPIARMVERVKRWIADGIEVRIMTARVSNGGGFSEESKLDADGAFVAEQRVLIQEWCKEHLGVVIPVTHEKDFRMVELWDDRAVQVIPNTGLRADGAA
jgi:RES domain-containing protein